MHANNRESGFSLIELAIVLTVIGLMLAMGIPAFQTLSQSQSLRGASLNVAGQITLARTRAMATGVSQTVNFDGSTTPARVVVLSGTASRTWALPKGITFASANSFNMTSDGRASTSQYIVLQNRRAIRDTVSVQTSGLVLVR